MFPFGKFTYLFYFIYVHHCSFPLGERFVWYLSGCNSPCATSGSYLMEKSTHISNSSEVDTEGEHDTTSADKALRCYCEYHSLILVALGVSSGGFSTSVSLATLAQLLLVVQDHF